MSTRVRKAMPMALMAVLLSACGGGATPQSPEEPSLTSAAQSPPKEERRDKARRKVSPSCERAASDGTRVYRVCSYFAKPTGKSFISVTGRSGNTRTIAGPPPADHLTRISGHWRDVWPSPGGRMLLAQWSGECEIPTAFFIAVDDGTMRVVTHQRDWTKAPESEALGWTPEGLALVRLGEGLCGVGALRPGVYAIDPAGGSTFLRP